MSKRLILADVNIWLSTLVEQHPHHDIAVQWWQREVIPNNEKVVFCRITQLGLLRLLTNEKVMGSQRRTLEQAFSDYSQLLAQNIVDYADEPDGLEQKLKSYCHPRPPIPKFLDRCLPCCFCMLRRFHINYV